MKKIFVVDDEMLILKILSDILTKEGYKVFPYANGLEVLKNIDKLEPDLIISDISMPKLNGLDLCQALKNRKNSKNIPVILITASKNVSDFADGVNLGVRYYCQKPLEVKDILDKVKKVLT